MPLKADKKQAEAYQWNAIRAQYPLLADVLTDMKKRLRKLELLCARQQKHIRGLEAQIQPRFAEKMRRSIAE